jgi:hypothetical protein
MSIRVPENSGFRAVYPDVINFCLTMVKLLDPDRLKSGIHSTEPGRRFRASGAMAKPDQTSELSWPWWATWALLAVAATSLLTIAATLYDIL